eukprot:CAMPEP_0168309512 /NCGR_PEP_ID=MMETSP0142_2-20121227/66316_1 /TAXON_ID=44445 /ORGANISM="Pseudo-nitzschia australis, Strain 10249 10 AB" /LENGTH=108 /DNA_ID=CAMNT_0008262237 /DNA_START=495 /DNA_END=821 /DNA_ORIENTATION=+
MVMNNEFQIQEAYQDYQMGRMGVPWDHGLTGRPLYDDSSSSSSLLSTPLGAVEPVAMQGSMVMNNEFQIQEAYQDYQMGRMGVPWDHELNDEEWREHVRRTTATRMQP